MALEAKRKLLQSKLELRIKELGRTHPATIEVSKNLDIVVNELQKQMNK